jgi:hypothetical protein
MRPLVLGFALTISGLIAAIGCSLPGEDAESTNGSLARETDLQLAKKAVALLAGTGAKCNTCHTAGREDIRTWAADLRSVEASCLAPELALTPAERVACLRKDPANPESPFIAAKLGLASAGAALPEFEAIFRGAYPADQWESFYLQFKEQAGMPAIGPGFTADQYATVKRWALAGAPMLDAVLDEPGAFACEPKTTPELAAHLATMKTDGWGAKLAAASTPMAGCGAATSADQCLATLADLTPTWGVSGTRQTLRQLRAISFRSSYWVRSSADGRFAAFGGSPSRIIDLQAAPEAAAVEVDAPYDPGFFPNNDGFSYAGTFAGGLRVCRQSVLLAAFAAPGGPRRITMTEPGCTRIIDTVYQSVGAALDGSVFFMVTGAHTNDNGGSNGPLTASFGATAVTTVTPMYNDGTKYAPGPEVRTTIPHEGDQQMSPSNRLLITRFGQRAGTAGFRIRAITPTFGGAGSSGIPSSVTLSLKDLGTVCLAGGKPQLSFDERFMAVHQYVDAAANPQGLPAKTSNIFVHDLKTGKTVQVTKLPAGHKALYPHFRADGWLYFLVRDSASKETLVASDVALQLGS